MSKVCMISSLHGLYDDRIYWKEAHALKNAGHEVIHLAVGSEEKDIISEDNIRLIQIKKKTYCENIYLDKLYKILLFKPSVYIQLLNKAAGLHADVYHFHDYQILGIAQKLKKLPQHPKVIYDVHEPYPVTLANTFAPNFLVKLIHVIYASYLRQWEIKKARHTDLIIATEGNVEDKFKRVYGEKKTTIIYNYSDLIPPKNPKTTSKQYDLIYCGGIRTSRGALTMIEITAALRKKFPGIKLLLVGIIHEARLRGKIEKRINELDIKENVIIKPFTPYKQIPDYYAASKIGLALFDDNPVHRTILPIKLFEYMTFGLPVVCSNIGHLGAITNKYVTGITVQPGNRDEITDAITRLLEDEKFYMKLSNNASQTAGTNFNWDVMAEKLVGVYEELCKKDL